MSTGRVSIRAKRDNWGKRQSGARVGPICKKATRSASGASHTSKELVPGTAKSGKLSDFRFEKAVSAPSCTGLKDDD